MYTGIVDHMGTILAIHLKPESMEIQIQCQFQNLTLGESVAIDGICLTVTGITADGFYADISPETLRLTTAKTFNVEQKINLERSLRVGDHLGGHFVLGHIDKTATLKHKNLQNDFLVLTFGDFEKSDLAFLSKKGSIAVNGVSLTINALTEDGFEVMLIPHTQERTSLKALQVGESVNIEFDSMTKMIIQHVEQFLKNRKYKND